MIYEAEILCLGNEILIGRTINTNGSFLAKHLSQLGFKVTRITTVRDELEAGQNIILEILQRKPHALCITGGLGPTHDDIQLILLSHALQRPLVRNEEAFDMIKKRYQEMNPSREKMAELPEGSSPLHNSQGSAPGVLTISGTTMIFSMPGVPREMEAIFSQQIAPLLNKKFEFDEETYEFGVDVRGVRESDLTEFTTQVMKEFPNISFKSHPKKDEEGFFLSLHTYAITTDRKQVENALRKWIEIIEMKYTVTKMTDIRSVMEF